MKEKFTNVSSSISKTSPQWLRLGKNYSICYATTENFAFIELYPFLVIENHIIETENTAFPLNSISQNIQFRIYISIHLFNIWH